MNQADLIKTIAIDTCSTQLSVKLFLESLQDVLKKELKINGKFELKDVGIFQVMDTAARTGRNPSTGEVLEIPAGKRVKFKVAKSIKDSLK